jgi:ketosteroid isomerase-like protein
MSDRHVEIVRARFEAFKRGDREAIFAGVWYGHDGVLEVFANWTEGFDDFEMTLEEPVSVNDSQVLARSHQTAVGKQSRAPIEGDFWLVYTFRDYRLVRFDIFATEAQARSGLSG